MGSIDKDFANEYTHTVMATLRSETLSENILKDAYSNTVCTPKGDRGAAEGICNDQDIWRKVRKPLMERID